MPALKYALFLPACYPESIRIDRRTSAVKFSSYVEVKDLWPSERWSDHWEAYWRVQEARSIRTASKRAVCTEM